MRRARRCAMRRMQPPPTPTWSAPSTRWGSDGDAAVRRHAPRRRRFSAGRRLAQPLALDPPPRAAVLARFPSEGHHPPLEGGLARGISWRNAGRVPLRRVRRPRSARDALMATLTITVPNAGRVPAVLLDVAAREGFSVGATYVTPADALQAWLRGRLPGIYREQARAAAREQALSDAEATIETAAATIA